MASLSNAEPGRRACEEEMEAHRVSAIGPARCSWRPVKHTADALDHFCRARLVVKGYSQCKLAGYGTNLFNLCYPLGSNYKI